MGHWNSLNRRRVPALVLPPVPQENKLFRRFMPACPGYCPAACPTIFCPGSGLSRCPKPIARDGGTGWVRSGVIHALGMGQCQFHSLSSAGGPPWTLTCRFPRRCHARTSRWPTGPPNAPYPLPQDRAWTTHPHQKSPRTSWRRLHESLGSFQNAPRTGHPGPPGDLAAYGARSRYPAHPPGGLSRVERHPVARRSG
jgi:hypothetical protein